MEASQVPTYIPLPFAKNAGAGYVNSIPTASQIGIQNGRASFNDGFVPLNFTPIAAGGVPPFGGDFNGLLLQMSAGIQWQQAGAPVFYNAAFQTLIGGYPNNAIVASVAYPGNWWQSTVDNNTSDPDAAGANWIEVVPFTVAQSAELARAAVPHGEVAHAGDAVFVVPANVTQVFVQVTGGGGGGAGANGSIYGGGGGGAGGYIEWWITVTPGQNVTITVGAGGLGSGAGVVAGDGGASVCLGLTANGGGGGSSFVSTAAGGGGGGASGIGGLAIQGGDGSDGIVATFGGGEVPGGTGGSSYWGGGGRGGSGGGDPGKAYGSGGGGSYNNTGNGANGQAGVVVIRW